MSAGSAKLDRLYAALTARERVALLLQALLADDPADPALRATLPPEQSGEFNRLVGIANGVLHVLAPVAEQIAGEAEALGLRAALLTVLAAWGSDRARLAADAALLARIPIGETEHAARLEHVRHAYLPMREAAALVAQHRGISRSKAMNTVRVAAVELTTRRRGRTFEVEHGPLADWLGTVVPCAPDWGVAYEVVPDAALERYAAAQAAAICLRQPDDAKTRARVTQDLAARVRLDLSELWGRCAALVQVVDEVVAEFQEDALVPSDTRACIAEAQAQLEQVIAQAVPAIDVSELSTIDERFAELLRRAVRSEVTGG